MVKYISVNKSTHRLKTIKSGQRHNAKYSSQTHFQYNHVCVVYIDITLNVNCCNTDEFLFSVSSFT